MVKNIFIVLFIGLIACKREKSKQDLHAQDANEFMNSSSFDELVNRFEGPERDAYQKKDALIEYFDLRPDDIVADIGAGSGYFTFAIAPNVKKTIAIDIDDRFLNLIEKRKSEYGEDFSEWIETRKGTAKSPELNQNEADVAIMVNVAHHISKRAKYFNKVRNGLQFEGRFFIVDFKKGDLPVGPPSEHKIPIETLKEELGLAGFLEIEVDSQLLDYQYIIRAK